LEPARDRGQAAPAEEGRALKRHGVVAAGDPQTARAGTRIFEAGGNAVDAAVAAGFAAFVCELPLCSPLGGGAMLLSGVDGATHALDLFARGPGLGGARPAELDFVDVEVSFGAATQVFHVGRASAAVPLALPGLLEAHRRWGSLPLSEIVAPAVELGKKGYVLGPGVAFVFQILTPIVERTPECRKLFSDGDAIAKTGARLDNPDLASALEDIGKNPARVDELYAALARELGPAEGGLITEQDVRTARLADLEPVTTRHAGYELFTMPGPSTGGVLVALGLRLLEGVGTTQFLSSEHLLAIARCQEILLGVRDEHFDERCRDPAEARALLDESRIAELRGNPLGSTTHISVLDDAGAAVSLTLTNGEGNGHVLSGTGMVVNNLLGEEDIHPHGFHLDPPGRALATMMAPTILRRGDERLALGSGGSNRLRNAILQVLVGMVEHGVDAERAVSAPRLHLEGTKLSFESTGLEPSVAQALGAAYPNPVIFDAPNLYFGGVHVARGRDERFDGAGDPRRGGAVGLV
jgi:gamma-glutamyltranspeptidase / glutathione hydrolase